MDKGSYYDSISSGYNRLHKNEQERKLKIIVDFLDIPVDSWFLDVGCGTGVSFSFIKSNFIFGIDPSLNLLKLNADYSNLINCQGERLPYCNGKFDIVLCLTAIHNFDDYSKGILEMKRVAKDKSTIIITVLKRTKKTDSISSLIKSSFNVKLEIEDIHDFMFICDNEKKLIKINS